MKWLYNILITIVLLPSLNLYAIMAYGAKYGIGAPTAYEYETGQHIETVDSSGEVKTSLAHTFSFSTLMGLSKKSNFITNSSVSYYTHEIKSKQDAASETESFESYSMNCFGIESDFLYSYFIMSKTYLFGGLKMHVSMANTDSQATTSYNFSQYGLGPGFGIGNNMQLMNNLFLQSKISIAAVFAMENINTTISGVDLESNTNQWGLYDASMAFAYYLQSIRSSVSLGVQTHLFVPDFNFSNASMRELYGQYLMFFVGFTQVAL